MEINKKIEQITHSSSLTEGILDVNKYPFADPSEVQALCNQPFFFSTDTLLLQKCQIAQQASVLEQAAASSVEMSTSVAFRRDSIRGRQLKLKTTKAAAVAELIAKGKWRVIDISQNNTSEPESATLLEKITAQPNLRELDFGYNALGEKSMLLLANYLKDSKCKLKYLKLRGNGITNPAIFLSLIAALKKNTSLRELELGSTKLEVDDLLDQLVVLLKNNKTITKITIDQLPDSAYSDERYRKCIQPFLNYNNGIRIDLHRELLSAKNFRDKANSFINEDNPERLGILFGVPKKHEAEIEFSRRQKELFIQLRQAEFSYNLAIEIVNFLAAITPEELQCPNKLADRQQEVEKILSTSQALEISVINENWQRTGNEIVEGKLTQLTAKRAEKMLAELSDMIIGPVLPRFRLCLNAETKLTELIQTYTEIATDNERLVSILVANRTDLQNDNENIEAKRKLLLKAFKQLDGEEGFLLEAQEYEEIAERFIEQGLNPDSIADEQGNTLLLKCFTEKKLNCFTLLLVKGASILKKNDKGESVFSKFISSAEFTRCHEILHQHIKSVLNDLWFKLGKYPGVQMLKTVKEILDSYLDILLKYSKMPKFQRIITGVEQCYQQRKQEIEKYYSYISDATEQGGKTPLNKLLTDMLSIAQNAKRGALEKSKLHDGILTIVLPLVKELKIETLRKEVRDVEIGFEEYLKMTDRPSDEVDLLVGEFVEVATSVSSTLDKGTKSSGNFKDLERFFLWKRFEGKRSPPDPTPSASSSSNNRNSR